MLHGVCDMKKFWLNDSECTGCGACENVCPIQAIEMKSNKYGFKYPCISEQCIECNLCENTCLNRLNLKPVRFDEPITYAAWSKDSNTRYSSTSGGIFSELAKYIFGNKGGVAGAKYRKDNLVEHVFVYNQEDLAHLRQSKYVQSISRNIYAEVKENLLNGLMVGFCGTPCQVAGLYADLGKDYDNLITFDFICRGVNSPKAYMAWLKEIEETEKKEVKRVWFKYKDGGWKSSPTRTRIDFIDGSYTVKEGKNNLFMCGYLSANLYIRPCCGECQFKGIPRQGDITLADFWGIEKILDDDKGTSMVLINSKKGKEIFDSIKENINFYERQFKEIFEGNVCFSDSVNVPKESEAFLLELDKISFSKAVKMYTKNNNSYGILNKIGKYIWRRM